MRPQHRGEDGASLVELAIILPLLVLFIFGTIDFGWAFGQHLDVKSGSREGARLAVVNAGFPPNPDPVVNAQELIETIRNRTSDLEDTDTAVKITLGGGSVGDNLAVCIRYPLESISGILAPFMNGQLKARTVMRLEQEPRFAAGESSNWPAGVTCPAS